MNFFPGVRHFYRQIMVRRLENENIFTLKKLLKGTLWLQIKLIYIIRKNDYKYF